MDDEGNGIDKRVFVRHPTEIPIEVFSTKIDGPICPNLKDISEGGISFRSKENFPKGELIEITIPFVTPVFHSKGIIVWTRRDGQYYEIGVRFHNSSDAFRVRMIEQICYIETYRRAQLEEEGRMLTSEEAALEWIERFASSFPRDEE
ncbi:MAG: PilZ domain-containing protein [Deltaproteobacteria bacterium]|nr:PilZ domain-containing protein [Deltaproteobacteria bacterium]